MSTVTRKVILGAPVVAHWVKNLTSIHGDAGLIHGLAQWVKDRHCHKLWYRSLKWLGSHVAVTLLQAGSYSSD